MCLRVLTPFNSQTTVAYLWFQLKTHSYLFEAESSEDDEEEAKMNIYTAVGA